MGGRKTDAVELDVAFFATFVASASKTKFSNLRMIKRKNELLAKKKIYIYARIYLPIFIESFIH
jgi:hypothetical protein